jgi:hypothetical protein
MSSRLTKKSLVSAPGGGEDAVLRAAGVGARTRRPPTSTVISGAVRVSSCALSISSASAGTGVLAFEVVAEAVGDGLEHGEGLDVGLLLRGVHASRRERHGHGRDPAFFAACSTPAQPASTIRSASETFLPPLAASVERRWMPSSVLEHLRELRRAG